MLQYFDKLPYLERAAGRRWFRRYVADPIPEHISNLSGGYRGGLARGIILTTFEYDPPFERHSFPAGWEPQDVAVAGILLANLFESYLGVRPGISRGYAKPANPSGGGSAWLLIDEAANKGILYEAAYFPLHQRSGA